MLTAAKRAYSTLRPETDLASYSPSASATFDVDTPHSTVSCRHFYIDYSFLQEKKGGLGLVESMVLGCRWRSEPFVVSMHLHLHLHLHFYGPISPSIVVCLPNILIDDSPKLTLSAWSSCLQMLLLFALPQHTSNSSALAFDPNSCLFMLHVSLQFPFHLTRLALPGIAFCLALSSPLLLLLLMLLLLMLLSVPSHFTALLERSRICR